jgi:hypothetical protein
VLDFSYLRRLPFDKAGTYRNLAKALRSLEEHMRPLTLAQALADDGLAEALMAFHAALREAQQAMGEDVQVKLSQTIDDLRWSMEPGGEWPASYLMCGDRARFPNLTGEDLTKRTRKQVRDLLAALPRFCEPNSTWQHIKNRIAAYANALLVAVKPDGLEVRKRRPTQQRPRWDGMILWYGDTELRTYQKRAAPNQAAILSALQRARWRKSPVPLSGKPLETLHVTLGRINEEIKDKLISLHAAGDGKSVFWRQNAQV